MSQVTIIGEEVATVSAGAADGRILIEPGRLEEALGWTLKAEGLCRHDQCVPVADAAALHVDGRLDLAAVAAALGRMAVVDAEAGLAAVALPAEERRRALDGLQAPAFTLADLDGVPHSLADWGGQKKLLVAFASW